MGRKRGRKKIRYSISPKRKVGRSRNKPNRRVGRPAKKMLRLSGYAYLN